jgi:threonine dehydratase
VDKEKLSNELQSRGYGMTDLCENEMAKVHARHLAGGRSMHNIDVNNNYNNNNYNVNNNNNGNNDVDDDKVQATELLYRFEFPESPGALNKFLQTINHFNQGWSISLFHYRNHGHDFGRVLVGLLVHKDEKIAFVNDFLDKLEYTYYEETENIAYTQFLK